MGETIVANDEVFAGRDEDVGRFDVTVQDPHSVEGLNAKDLRGCVSMDSGTEVKWKHTISAAHRILSPVVTSQLSTPRRSSRLHGYRSITK